MAEAEAQKKKEAEKDRNPWEFDLSKCNVADISKKLKWNKLNGVMLSSEGSSGVIFTKIGSSGAVVKSCATIATELFASELAQLMDVPCPQMRVLEYTNPEWGLVKKMLHARSKFGRNGNPLSLRMRRKIGKELDRPNILVMELLPDGQMLEGMTKADAAALFTPATLTQVGVVLGFDAFINNSDRLRSLWDNIGNGRNLLLSKSLGAVAIDQVINALDLKSEFSAAIVRDYFAKVERLLCGALHLTQPKIKSTSEGEGAVQYARKVLGNVRAFISASTGHDVGEASLSHMAQGIVTLVANVTLIRETDLLSLKEWLDKAVRLDWANVWADSARLVRTDYLRRMLTTFHTAAKAFQSLGGELPTPSSPLSDGGDRVPRRGRGLRDRIQKTKK